MTSLRILLHRFVALLSRRNADAELDDEIHTHLALLKADYERRGLTPEDARHAALRAFGGVEQMKEIYRDGRGLPVFESLIQDARYGLRALRRNPGFAVVAVLTLALGIGANSAFFSVIDALMLRQLPVNRPDDLVVFTARDDRPNPDASFSYPLYQDFRGAADLFEGIAAASGGTLRGQLTIAGPDGRSGVEAIDVEAVSGNFFAVVGVPAVLGRTLVDADDTVGSPQPVVVLSHAFWQRRFGGDARVIGSRFTIDGVTFTVVGVAAERFEGFEVGEDPDAWWPLQMIEEMSPAPLARLTTQRNSEWLRIIGRLKPGADPRSAQAQMSVVFRRDLEETFKRRSRPGRPMAAAEREALLQQRLELVPGATGWSELRLRFARPMLVLMIGVGAVLLVTCANIANLLLARAAARRQEISIRLAIGAGRRRVVRQLLTESLVLSVIGGVVGLAVGMWVRQLLVSFVPDPNVTLDARLDGRVLLFTLAIATAAGLVFGLGPAFSGTALQPQAGLAGPRSTAPRRKAVTNALVVSQVALSVIVLLGAGLFLRTLRNLQNVDLGFEQDRLTVFRVAVPAGADAQRRTAAYREIVRRLQQQPGVTAASFSFFGLLSDMNRTQRVNIPGYAPKPDESMSVQFSHVERSFFDVTGIRIVEGRAFDSGDEATGRRVAVIDRTMARRYFGGRAVGRRFALEGPSGPESDALEVIGVAADAKYRNVREEPLATVYTPVGDRSAGIPVPASVQVRTSASAALGEQTIVRVVREVEPGAVVTNVATMTQVLDRVMAEERLLSTLAGLFSVLALTVAAIGLYGVRSFAVASRTREIGIRMALGASRGAILRSLLGQGMALVLVGVGLGTAAALLLTRSIETFLYRVEPDDPATLVGVAAVLGLSTLMASYIPARRATRINPVAALRTE